MVTNSTRLRYIKPALALAVILAIAVAGVVSAGSRHDKKAGTKGYLGVFMQELDDDVRDGLDIDVEEGVLISGVEEDSPADEAGIEDGDVLVMFDGHDVDSPGELKELVQDTDVGKEVDIVVIRDGKKKTLTLVVGDQPEGVTWNFFDSDFSGGNHWQEPMKLAKVFGNRGRLGVEVFDLNDDLARYFDTEAGEGVLVLRVKDESVAEDAGIRAGDVIEKVDDEPVSTIEELLESLVDYEEGDKVDIVVKRDGKQKTLTATMDEPEGAFIWSGRTPHFDFDTDRISPHRYKTFIKSIDMDDVKDDLADEIKQLKKEMKKMKKELKELKK